MKQEKLLPEWMAKMTKQVGVLLLKQPDFAVVYVNELLKTELEYPDLETFQMNTVGGILEGIHPEEREACLRFLMLESEYPENPKFKCRVRTRYGRFLWYEISRVHCLDAEGHSLLLCTLINISRYMEAHQALSEMEQEIHDVSVQLETVLQDLSGGSDRAVILSKPPIFQYVSDTFCQLCGWERGAPGTYAEYLALLSEEDQGIHESIMKELAKYPHQTQMEYQIRRADGSLIRVSDTLRSFRRADGVMVVHSTLADLGKLQYVDAARSMLEDLLVQTAHQPKEVPGTVVIRLAIPEHTAYLPKDLAERYRLPEILPQMPYPLLEAGYILEESMMEYLNFYRQTVEGQEGTVELKMRDASGEIRWHKGISRILRNQEESVVAAILTFQDITERKSRRERLKSLEHSGWFFQKLAECSGRVILKYEFRSGCFFAVTPEAQRLFAHGTAPLLPINLFQAGRVASESLPQVHNAFLQMKEQLQDGELCIRVNQPDGRDTWYQCAYHVIFHDDMEPIYGIVFCDEVTQRRELDLAAQCFWNQLQTEEPSFLSLRYNLTEDRFERSEGKIPAFYGEHVMTSYTKAYDWMCGQICSEDRERFRKFFSRERLFQKQDAKEFHGEDVFLSRYKERTLRVKMCYEILLDSYTGSVELWIRCRDIGEKPCEELKPLKTLPYGLRPIGIYIQTFGHFGIFIQGQAVPIRNAKARELLALLVDRRGGFLTAEEIVTLLWEDEPISTVTLTRVRQTVKLLKDALKEYTQEEVVESHGGLRRLNVDLVQCDLFDYVSRKDLSLYQGVYMPQYPWSELTIPELEQIRKGVEES